MLVQLAASLIILWLVRPVRLSRAAIPSHPPASNSVLLLFLGALALTLGVALDGDLSDTRPVTGVGITASVTIGIAMALRAREAIRTTEGAYARLDRALAEAEQSRDQLMLANDELRHGNVQLNAMHIALADALNLADERSEGRMREPIEDTGEELAELLEEHMEHGRPV